MARKIVIKNTTRISRGRKPKAPKQGRISNKTDKRLRTIVKNIPSSVLKSITKEIFPEMEKEMQSIMLSWNGAFVDKDNTGSVYNTFRYSKETNMNSSRKQISFSNYAIHAPALVGGVNPRKGPWFVGDWIRKMDKLGKLRNSEGLKRRDGTYGQFLMGIGETTRRPNKVISGTIRKHKRKLAKLTDSKRFKGRTKKIEQTKRKIDRMETKQRKKPLTRKFSALVKGKSKRDFWSPTIRNYFGNITTSGSREVSSGRGRGKEAVKKISNKIYRDILKNTKK